MTFPRQCGTCHHWRPERGDTCALLRVVTGSTVYCEATDGEDCEGYYGPAEDDYELLGAELALADVSVELDPPDRELELSGKLTGTVSIRSKLKLEGPELAELDPDKLADRLEARFLEELRPILELPFDGDLEAEVRRVIDRAYRKILAELGLDGEQA